MTWQALSCPQCSAPLPRVALWRSVKCESCGALIQRGESLVERKHFAQALQRSRQAVSVGAAIVCRRQSYQLLEVLGEGECSQVHLGQSLGPLPMRVTIKLSSAPQAAARFAQEARVLGELSRLDGDAGAHLELLLPQVVAQGPVDDAPSRHALLLRHTPGFWGDLAALSERFPQGIDPRHSVWIWRRMLTTLALIHSEGWCHGDIRPEHAIVNGPDHAVLLIGWSAAGKADAAKVIRDLSRSARVIQVLLCGAAGSLGSMPSGVPRALVELVQRAAEDEAFCGAQGAAGLDSHLLRVARDAFGPPKYVPLIL